MCKVASEVKPAQSLPHTIQHYVAVESTCTQSGNIEYWACSVCDTYFSNANAETVIEDKSSVVIAMKPHSVAPTFSGTAHWETCGSCDLVFEMHNTVLTIEHEGHRYECPQCDWEIALTAHDGDTCSACKYQPGALSYQLSDDETYATVQMNGTPAGNIIIASLYNGKPVTTINAEGFKNGTDITGVTIPDNVTTISDSAFEGCTSLESVTLGSSVKALPYKAFYNCSSLASITIPDSVESIGYYAFSNCSSLESVTVPDSVILLGINVFYKCSSLESVTLGNGVTSIPESAFYQCTSLTSVSIPDSVTTIKYSAFNGCSSLTEVKLPSKLETISSKAFYGTALQSLVIPANVTSISGDTTFPSSSITSVSVAEGNTTYYSEGNCLIETGTGTLIFGCSTSEIPVGVTSIKSYAFYECKALTSITIPETVKEIGSYAFYKCTSLAEVTISEGVEAIKSHAFDNCAGIDELTIPGSVKTIEKGAFGACYLKKLEISEGVETIGAEAFWFSNITELVIPDSVTSIGKDSFSYCKRLVSVVLGEGLTAIPQEAFEQCIELCSLTINKGVTEIGTNAFNHCNKLVEIYNLSALELTLGSEDYGKVALMARVIHDSLDVDSYIFVTGDFSFYGDGNGQTLMGYLGSDTELELPDLGGFLTYEINPGFIQTNTEITSVTVPNCVTAIGTEAFYNCTSLKTLVFEKNSKLEAIHDKAFSGCVQLEEINLPEGLKTIGQLSFYNCKVAKTLSLPNTLTTIGPSAFSTCEALTSITIPENVTMIDNGAFNDCYNLSEIYYNAVSAQTSTEYYAINFSYAGKNTDGVTLYIGENVEKIPYGLFRHYHNSTAPYMFPYIVKVVFAQNSKCTVIEDYAFWKCYTLREIELPDSLTTIGANAFYYCTSLNSITIPEGVTSIGANAFSYCYKLVEIYNLSATLSNDDVQAVANNAKVINSSADADTLLDIVDDYVFIEWEGQYYLLAYIGSDKELVLPESYKGNTYAIHDYAFYSSIYITSVTVPDGVTSIGNNAFGVCRSLTSISIPGSVKTIGSYVFTECYALTDVTISEGVTSIGGYAFKYCTALTSISIPGSVETIGSYAFQWCRALSSVTLSDGIKSIGDRAFYECDALVSLTIPYSVTNIGSSLFYNCNVIANVTVEAEYTSSSSGCTGTHYSVSATRLKSNSTLYRCDNECQSATE